MARNALKLIELNKQTKNPSLDLSRCWLKDENFPIDEMQKMTHLTELYLNKAEITDISALKTLVNLRRLDLSNTKVSDIRFLKSLTQLETLYLGGTNVSDISCINNLSALKILDLGRTRITDISPLHSLNQLRVLHLNSTPISNISPLSSAFQLQILYLNNTQVSDTSSLQTLNQLKRLNLSNTKVLDITSLKTLKELQILDLSNSKVSNISDLKYLNQLISLRLEETKVSDISPLKSMKELKELDLGQTLVRKVSSVVNLTELQTLSLNNTRVRDISPLKTLSKLKILDLSNSDISDISSLKDLRELEMLYLRNTQISELSPLKSLTQIQNLDLGKTKVSDIASLLSLIEKGIPVKFESNDHENQITVELNLLTHPPIEIVKQGNEAIINYFRELEDGEVTVFEAKLLIVGEAGAGKTTLARKLRDPNAPMPDVEKDTTRGIQVDELIIQESGLPDFTMHVWDFGGQEIYHSTHQFFLSKRSLYVLLLDGRIEEDPHYWLQVQDLLGEDSPLLILLNQKGKIRQQIAFQELVGLYPNLRKPLYQFSLKNNHKSIDRFGQSISRHIRSLPHFQRGEKVPRKWVRIRSRLQELTNEKNYISLDEFRKICRLEGINEHKRQNFLSDFLHSLGIILHFSQVPLLRKILILNPSWATEAVYKVLDHTRENASIPGHFYRHELSDIWSDIGYSDVFDELLTLMEKFELCYPLRNRPNEFIVPQLLPHDKPKINWKEKRKLQLRYEYTFMPKGIVTRLIVRLHANIKDQSTVWKRGAIFDYKGAKAEVSELFRDRRIQILVIGPNSKALLTIIAKEIDEINDTFDFDDRLRVEQLIPCNCQECRTKESPYFFPKDVLENARFKGVNKTQCQYSFKTVSVLSLIDDVFIKKIDESSKEKVFQSKESLAEYHYHFHKEVGSVNPNNQGLIIQEVDQQSFYNQIGSIQQLIEVEQHAGYITKEEYEELMDILQEIIEAKNPSAGQQRRWKRWLGKAVDLGSKFVGKKKVKEVNILIGKETKKWLDDGGLDQVMKFVNSL